MIDEMGILVVGSAISDNLSTICRPCPAISTCLVAWYDFCDHNGWNYFMLWGNSRVCFGAWRFCLL